MTAWISINSFPTYWTFDDIWSDPGRKGDEIPDLSFVLESEYKMADAMWIPIDSLVAQWRLGVSLWRTQLDRKLGCNFASLPPWVWPNIIRNVYLFFVPSGGASERNRTFWFRRGHKSAKLLWTLLNSLSSSKRSCWNKLTWVNFKPIFFALLLER
jgi:hypothetical protein